MLKREWDAESNGKLPHLFIPSKTAIEVPEFAMEDLPLGRIAALVPELAVKDLLSGRTLLMIINKLTSLCTVIFFQYVQCNTRAMTKSVSCGILKMLDEEIRVNFLYIRVDINRFIKFANPMWLGPKSLNFPENILRPTYVFTA